MGFSPQVYNFSLSLTITGTMFASKHCFKMIAHPVLPFSSWNGWIFSFSYILIYMSSFFNSRRVHLGHKFTIRHSCLMCFFIKSLQFFIFCLCSAWRKVCFCIVLGTHYIKFLSFFLQYKYAILFFTT